MTWYAKSKRRENAEPYIITDAEKQDLDEKGLSKRYVLTPLKEKQLKPVPIIHPEIPEEIKQKKQRKANGKNN